MGLVHAMRSNGPLHQVNLKKAQNRLGNKFYRLRDIHNLPYMQKLKPQSISSRK